MARSATGQLLVTRRRSPIATAVCAAGLVVERLSPMPSFRRRTLPTPRASRNISSRLTLPCVDFAEAAVVSSPFSTSENEKKSPRTSGSLLAAWIGRMRLNPLTISSQPRNSLGFIWISNWLIGPASSLGFAQASIPPKPTLSKLRPHPIVLPIKRENPTSIGGKLLEIQN